MAAPLQPNLDVTRLRFVQDELRVSVRVWVCECECVSVSVSV